MGWMQRGTAVRAEQDTPRRPRPRLERESIIEAGLEITARPGTRTLSVRDLGQRLGSDPTAIYRHFRNKEDLVLHLLDTLTARAVAAVDAPAANWRERLTQLSEASLAQYTAHPAVGVEAITATTHGPGEKASVELILDAFTTAGLDERAAVAHYALFAQYMMASASGLARAVMETGATDPSVPWFDAVPTADPTAHPLLMRLGGQLGELQDREVFRFGIAVILDAAERQARST